MTELAFRQRPINIPEPLIESLLVASRLGGKGDIIKIDPIRCFLEILIFQRNRRKSLGILQCACAVRISRPDFRESKLAFILVS